MRSPLRGRGPVAFVCGLALTAGLLTAQAISDVHIVSPPPLARVYRDQPARAEGMELRVLGVTSLDEVVDRAGRTVDLTERGRRLVVVEMQETWVDRGRHTDEVRDAFYCHLQVVDEDGSHYAQADSPDLSLKAMGLQAGHCPGSKRLAEGPVTGHWFFFVPRESKLQQVRIAVGERLLDSIIVDI